MAKKRGGRAKKVVNVNKRELDEMLSQNKFVLLFFWSTICPQCRLMSPMVDEISKKLAVKCVKANAGKHYRLAMKYNIFVTPTLVLFKKGEPIKTIKSLRSYDKLEKEILDSMGEEEDSK